MEGRKNDKAASMVPSLPALSTQSCPITIIRENSTLNKRMSYSDNLKERHSFVCDKGIPRLRTLSSFNKQVSSDSMRGDVENLKRDTSDLVKKKPRNQRNSLRECHHILVKLQRKLSNTSLKKANRRKRDHIASGHRKSRGAKKKNKVSTTNLFKDAKEGQMCNNSFGEHGDQGNKVGNTCQKYIVSNNDRDLCQRVQNSSQAVKKNHDSDVGECANSIDHREAWELHGKHGKSINYSEKQSSNVDGVPGAPPCTPNELLSNKILSLSDVKSQRNMQQKLRELQKQHAKKEKEILDVAKVRAAERELERKKNLMENQRNKIYAMNKLLGEVEHQNFLKCKSQIHGMPV